MKAKGLRLFLGLLFMSIAFGGTAYADDTANIKINISGNMRNNDYFLCLPNIGCLSIAAAQQGKVYPIYHSIQMDNMSVVDVDNRFRVNFQGLPSSCDKTVETDQTITISGHLVDQGPNHDVTVEQLHCSIV